MLRTLAQLLGSDVPVIGVNFGRVGFLASIEPDDLERDLERVFAGEYAVVELPTLEVQLNGERHVAVNDVVATSSTLGRMVELAWAVGGEDLGIVPCDGMICSTPSGSTAYNLSNGGPVLVRGLDAMAVTFIAPHSLHARPLVVPRGLDGDRRATATRDVPCRRARRRPPRRRDSRRAARSRSTSATQRSLLATLPGDDVLQPLPRDLRVLRARAAPAARLPGAPAHQTWPGAPSSPSDPLSTILRAPPAAHREPRAHPGGRARARARAECDHGRDRRGQDDPRAGGRASARHEGRRLVRRAGRRGGLRRGRARHLRTSSRSWRTSGPRTRTPCSWRGACSATGARAPTRGGGRPPARTWPPPSSASSRCPASSSSGGSRAPRTSSRCSTGSAATSS